MEGTPTELLGWKSQFDMAARTMRRIVLHGNVMDVVHDGVAGVVPLVDWVRRRLAGLGFRRVIHYDHVHPPAVLFGDTPAALRGLDRGRRLDAAATLELLERVVLEPEAAAGTDLPESGGAPPGTGTALILSASDHLVRNPGREFAMLNALAAGTELARAPRHLLVHLFTSENGIPPDYLYADPDTRAVFVPTPGYSERLVFLRSLPPDAPILGVSEHGSPVTPERLARVTEYHRLGELRHLAELAGGEGAGADLNALLSLYRFGRRHDNWAGHNIEAIGRTLRSRVLGQDEAAGQVIEGLYQAKHRVGELIEAAGRHPATTFFFVGPTGVGKTLMARTICEAVTGNAGNLKIFDMSEFMREHSDQRLIGSPPGYVGFDQGGELTNWVQQHPHSVVLFDEIEKAHQRVLDLNLQILDGARLTSGKGVTVDLRDTLLIFTSNLGSTRVEEMGIDKRDHTGVERYFTAFVEDFFSREIGRPELFNRLKNGIVVFGFLDREVAEKAVFRRLAHIAGEVNRRLSGRGIQIDFEPGQPEQLEVARRLVESAEVEKYGLREVDTQIRRLVGPGLGRFLDQEPARGRYRFEWDGAKGRITITGPHAR